MGTILIVDDNGDLLDSLRRSVEQVGHQVFAAIGPDEAITILRSQPIDLIICDQNLGDQDWSGTELIGEAARIRPSTRSILISALEQPEQEVRFLLKPFSREELLEHISEIIAA